MKKYLMENKRWEIKLGDIFKEDGLKVIPFNEHFDTLVDEKIVSSKTLHGMFLNRYLYNEERSEEDRRECSDRILDAKFNRDNVENMNDGRKISYKLGTIANYKDFLLVAFSKFDENEKAYLSSEDYDKCMMTMWENILKYYPGRKIVLPVMGSGITKLDFAESENDPEKVKLTIYYAELIEKMLKPLKELNVKNPEITIVIYEGLKGQIFFE